LGSSRFSPGMLAAERQNLSTTQGGGALGDLLAQLDLNQREQSLLAGSVLSAMHERVGALPARDGAPRPASDQPARAQRRRRSHVRPEPRRRLRRPRHSRLCLHAGFVPRPHGRCHSAPGHQPVGCRTGNNHLPGPKADFASRPTGSAREDRVGKERRPSDAPMCSCLELFPRFYLRA